MNFDWNDLAFGSKKPVNNLHATFIAAPRSMSPARFMQLVKEYLPKGNIVLGLAKEPYVAGLEGQPQFAMLRADTVQPIINKVNAASPTHKIYTLAYFQRDIEFVIEKLTFKKIVFINGSWKHLLHTLPVYYVLAKKRINYITASPFATEDEARNYEVAVMPQFVQPSGNFTETEMLRMAENTAKRSFDYGFQTGVTLGRKSGKKYKYITQGFNKVVPYQGYAMHHGASREINFSPMHDLNHYDTVHAEIDFILAVQKQKIDLDDTTLFINLLPCPTCARMFMETDIAEFMYINDHSEGYALKMLEAAGKKVRRIAL